MARASASSLAFGLIEAVSYVVRLGSISCLSLIGPEVEVGAKIRKAGRLLTVRAVCYRGWGSEVCFHISSGYYPSSISFSMTLVNLHHAKIFVLC